jgi:glycosyltransferase involved in cell wall biosynthesis
VAHIIGGLSIGGAERHLVNLLNAMSCEYRAAIFLGPEPSGPSFHQDLDPAIVQHFVRVRRRSLPMGILRLASVLRNNGVNVVHAHMFDSNLYGALAAKLAGVPVVVTSEHGENPWKGPLHRWLERRVISPLVDVRFCVSPQILALRRDADGVPASKLRLMVNGTLVSSRPVRRSPNPVLLIGAVGRFITAKDYPRLLAVVAELRRRGYCIELCIVGDGPEMDNVKRTAEDLNLNHIVEFPGLVTDVEDWYDRFDVYVSTSIREGQPVALLEAMAHGLPVLATDVGASAETVRHGECGLIVPAGDTTALASALGQLLDDADLRESFGRNARTRVELEYSVKAVAEMHLNCYRELLSKSRTTTLTAKS